MANILGVQVYTPEKLQSLNLIYDETPVISRKTGIKFRFPYYKTRDGAISFALIVNQNKDGTFNNFYVNTTVMQGQVRSDADAILISDKEKTFLKFPPYEDENLMRGIPGLTRDNTGGKFIIVPRWCGAGIYSLEVATSAGNENFTTILADRIDFGGAKYGRQIGSTNELSNINDPIITQKLTLYHVDKTAMERNITDMTNNLQKLYADVVSKQGEEAAKGNPDIINLAQQINNLQNQIKQYQDIPGDVFLKSNAASQFIGEIIIEPKLGFKNKIIGRPSCNDMVSNFIIPDKIVTATPIVQETSNNGFLTFVTEQMGVPLAQQIVELPSNIKNKVINYMENPSQGCKKGTCDVPRVTTNIRKIQARITGTIARDKWFGKYLNVSTGQYKNKDNKVLVYHGATIQGDVAPLQLSMTISDMKSILELTDDIENKIPDSSLPYVDAVFKLIEKIIIDTLGQTTQKSETGPLRLNSDIISIIPTKKPSLSTKELKSVKPLNQIIRVPFQGVAAIVVSKSDRERCIPSLSVKKRDLK